MLQHTATCCNTLQHTATNQLPEVGADPCKSSRSTSILPTNTLQHTATHCTSLHLTAPHCNSLPLTAHNAIYKSPEAGTGPCTCSRSSSTLPTDILQLYCNTMQLTATHYNILQHTATHSKSLQDTATHCNTSKHTNHPRQAQVLAQARGELEINNSHTATHCNTPQLIKTHCNALHCNALRRIATHYNALQRTAMHCNALQHINR